MVGYEEGVIQEMFQGRETMGMGDVGVLGGDIKCP